MLAAGRMTSGDLFDCRNGCSRAEAIRQGAGRQFSLANPGISDAAQDVRRPAIKRAAVVAAISLP
jgi:hypothetical protein